MKSLALFVMVVIINWVVRVVVSSLLAVVLIVGIATVLPAAGGPAVARPADQAGEPEDQAYHRSPGLGAVLYPDAEPPPGPFGFSTPANPADDPSAGAAAAARSPGPPLPSKEK